MTAMLNVKDLRAYYGQVQALHGLAFDLNEGSMTTLLGANGAGKTTTLRAICNMVRSTGAIEFDGASLTGRSTENIVRLGIAHVPEGRQVFPEMTVNENLEIGSYAPRAKADRARSLEGGRVEPELLDWLDPRQEDVEALKRLFVPPPEDLLVPRRRLPARQLGKKRRPRLPRPRRGRAAPSARRQAWYRETHWSGSPR